MAGLTEAEIVRALAGVPGWRREGKAIVRTWRWRDFKEAMFFVNGVGALAERADHHPDIDVRYREVRLALWTHSADGLTAKDFDLARAIDATFAC
jgi:4a-hydroxytetrahydrobiopterin dehydratase